MTNVLLHCHVSKVPYDKWPGSIVRLDHHELWVVFVVNNESRKITFPSHVSVEVSEALTADADGREQQREEDDEPHRCHF